MRYRAHLKMTSVMEETLGIISLAVAVDAEILNNTEDFWYSKRFREVSEKAKLFSQLNSRYSENIKTFYKTS